jgi:hypothetical protein
VQYSQAKHLSAQERFGMLKEIRIHGRGGQGSVTAAEVLAKAAFK